MKKLYLPLILSVASICTVSQAATVDIAANFTSTVGTNSSASLMSNNAMLSGTASISGSVMNLGSFQYIFDAGDVNISEFDDFSYFTTSAGTQQLASISTVGDFGSTGLRTYTFATPYSGSIAFGVRNVGDENGPSTLQVRNLTTLAAVTPVPEPGSLALLSAGLLAMAGTVRRRRQAPQPA